MPEEKKDLPENKIEREAEEKKDLPEDGGIGCQLAPYSLERMIWEDCYDLKYLKSSIQKKIILKFIYFNPVSSSIQFDGLTKLKTEETKVLNL